MIGIWKSELVFNPRTVRRVGRTGVGRTLMLASVLPKTSDNAQTAGPVGFERSTALEVELIGGSCTHNVVFKRQ